MWWYSMFFVLVFPIGECGAPAECVSFILHILSARLRRAGIPALYFTLLYTNRDKIAPDENSGETRATVPVQDQRRRSSTELSASPSLNEREAHATATQLKRREAHADGIAPLRLLYDSYEPRCMYFEVIECVR